MSPEITDEMIERLARHLYGNALYWDMGGENPHPGWKSRYREKARRYLSIALEGEKP